MSRVNDLQGAASLEEAVSFENIHNFFHRHLRDSERLAWVLDTLYALDTFEEQLQWAERLAALLGTPAEFDAEVKTLYDSLYI